MKPFPWFGFRERAAERQLAAYLDRLWLDGERVEDQPMAEIESKSDWVPQPACVICGRISDAAPLPNGGVWLTVQLCQAHTQSLAGKALRKITRRFLREQID